MSCAIHILEAPHFQTSASEFETAARTPSQRNLNMTGLPLDHRRNVAGHLHDLTIQVSYLPWLVLNCLLGLLRCIAEQQ